MKAEDRELFAREFARLGIAMREEISPELMHVYFDALDDLTIEQFERAVKAAIRTCRFFPKPAELRQLVVDTAAKPLRAFTRLQRSIWRRGVYDSPPPREKWRDPITYDVVEYLGGWRAVCTMRAEDLRDRFVRAYERFAAAEVARREPLAIEHDRQERLQEITGDLSKKLEIPGGRGSSKRKPGKE